MAITVQVTLTDAQAANLKEVVRDADSHLRKGTLLTDATVERICRALLDVTGNPLPEPPRASSWMKCTRCNGGGIVAGPGEYTSEPCPSCDGKGGK